MGKSAVSVKCGLKLAAGSDPGARVFTSALITGEKSGGLGLERPGYSQLGPLSQGVLQLGLEEVGRP